MIYRRGWTGGRVCFEGRTSYDWSKYVHLSKYERVLTIRSKGRKGNGEVGKNYGNWQIDYARLV